MNRKGDSHEKQKLGSHHLPSDRGDHGSRCGHTTTRARMVSIQVTKKKVTVTTDEKTFDLHPDVYLEHYFDEEDQDVDLDHLEALSQMRFCSEKGASYSLRSRRTNQQVRDYLRQDFPEEMVEETITLLEENGLLDDEAYAQDYIKSHQKTKGHRYIREKLYFKGIDYRGPIHEDPEDVLDILVKKYGTDQENSLTHRKKMTNFLLGRGFSYETIKIALKSYYKEDF